MVLLKPVIPSLSLPSTTYLLSNAFLLEGREGNGDGSPARLKHQAWVLTFAHTGATTVTVSVLCLEVHLWPKTGQRNAGEGGGMCDHRGDVGRGKTGRGEVYSKEAGNREKNKPLLKPAAR